MCCVSLKIKCFLVPTIKLCQHPEILRCCLHLMTDRPHHWTFFQRLWMSHLLTFFTSSARWSGSDFIIWSNSANWTEVRGTWSGLCSWQRVSGKRPSCFLQPEKHHPMLTKHQKDDVYKAQASESHFSPSETWCVKTFRFDTINGKIVNNIKAVSWLCKKQLPYSKAI